MDPWLGHRQFNTTRIYLRLTEEDVKRESLSRLLTLEGGQAHVGLARLFVWSDRLAGTV